MFVREDYIIFKNQDIYDYFKLFNKYIKTYIQFKELILARDREPRKSPVSLNSKARRPRSFIDAA